MQITVAQIAEEALALPSEARALLADRLVESQDMARLELKLTEHDGEFKLIKWMMGLLLGGVAALVMKAFF